MPKRARIDSVKNRILTALSREQYERLSPNLERVDLKQGQIIYSPGDRVRHAYFINTGVASSVASTAEGDSVEIGMVGNEGMVGTPAFLTNRIMFCRAVMQIGGNAMRISADVLRGELQRSGNLNHLLLNHTYALHMQVAQSAVCNRFHTIEERLCRWLLFCHDRVQLETLPITQEFLSHMLGSTRSAVTLTAGALQRSGLIRYKRGNVTILDREGLESASCECYRIVKQQYDRLFRN